MPNITRDNARELSALANKVRWDDWRAKQAAKLQAEAEQGQAKALPEIVPDLTFAERTLSRVRLQMDRLATEIDQEITGESKRLKELTDSYARLADQERILAGRPLPGSRKPAPDRPSKSGKRDLGVSDPVPQPQQAVSPPVRTSNPDEPNG